MLTKSALLDKMVSHFSKWMDIRRKPNTSNGGKLLGAIAEEASLLQAKIDEYVDMHFLENNIDQKDLILSHVYILNLGSTQIDLLSIVEPSLKITDDLKLFYSGDNYAYLQNGYIIIKEKDLTTKEVIYIYKTYKQSGTPELLKIWNIFDEFALYVGITRYDLPIVESNEDLIKRILISRQGKINSSKTGLKYALYSALSNLMEDVDINDITIENPSVDNILEITSNDQAVIDEVAAINKDVARAKKWDLDYWNHDLKSLDYLPHTWDYTLSKTANGIGDNDDLKPVLLYREEKITTHIDMYKKDDETITTYIKKNPIDVPITLKLVKPSNAISPIDIDFKITACHLTDVTTYNLGVKYSTTKHIERYFNISHFLNEKALSPGQNYTILDNRKLSAGRYNLIVHSRTDYEGFKIHKLTIGATNHIRETEDTYLSNGSLYIKSERFFGNKTYHFNNVKNFENSAQGLQLMASEKEAYLELPLKNMQNEKFKINVFCPVIEVENKFIQHNFMNEQNGTYTSYHPQSSLTLQLEANYVEARVKGNSFVKAYKDNILIYSRFTTDDEIVNIPQYETPHLIKIVISCVTSNSVTISNLKYNSYSLSYTTAYGLISLVENGYTLPDYSENLLSVSLSTNTETLPTIRGIHIGASTSEAFFETGIFTLDSEKELDIDMEGARITLERYDQTGTVLIEIVDDYKAVLQIKALKTFELDLDLSGYSEISQFYCENGLLKTYNVNGEVAYTLKIYEGAVIDEIFLAAEKKGNIQTIYFNTLFDIKPSIDEKLYIANLYPGLIIKREQGIELINLSEDRRSREIFDDQGDYEIINYTKATIDGTLPNTPFNSYFELYENGKTSIYTSHRASGRVTNFYFKNKDVTEFIAYNKLYGFEKQINNVKIVNTFYPFLPEQLLFYKLDSLGGNKVAFRKNNIFEENNIYSVGINNVNILTTFNVETMIDNEVIYLSKNITASKLLDFDNFTTTNENNSIDLSEYMIYPLDGEIVHYTNIPSDHFEEYPDYFFTQTVTVENDRFNKLYHCNIDHIVSVIINNSKLDKEHYFLIQNLGIIEWKENIISSISGNKATIIYQFKKPEVLELTNDKLYKQVLTDVEAYKLIKSTEAYVDFSASSVISFEQDASFAEADWILVTFDVPGYGADVMDNYIKIKKTIYSKDLAVQTGYYYLDNNEHYMFSGDIQDDIVTSNDITYSNINAKDYLELFAYNENQLLNSSFKTSILKTVYESNFKGFKPVSALGYLSACDTFNSWLLKGMTLSFTKGLNGQALSFHSQFLNGYGFLDLTDYLDELEEYMQISFYTSGLSVYLGEEDKYKETNYRLMNLVSLQCISTEASNNIVTHYFKGSKLKNYYLIVTGEGVLDDLILANANEEISHEKNIDKLKLDLKETNSPLINRVAFNRLRNKKSQGAFINHNGIIETQKNVDWSITKIKSFYSDLDWHGCSLQECEVIENAIIGCSDSSKIILPVIEIKNKEAINQLFVKINQIPFPNMSNLKVTIYGSNNYSDNYIKISNSTSHRITLANETDMASSKIYQFIKIEIDLYEGQILDSVEIYANYVSHANLRLTSSPSKVYLSEVYDFYIQDEYCLNDFNYSNIELPSMISIYYRTAKDGSNQTIFSEWASISLTEKFDPISLGYIRYLQFKVVLADAEASIKINYFDVKKLK